MKKKKILFILHYPPPVHGAANVGLQIKESKAINEKFDCKYINLGTSRTIEEIGKSRFVKLFRYFSIFGHVFYQIIFNRPDVCYFSMTAKCMPFYKDASLALLVKLFRVKLVYHFHNKGVKEKQDSFFDNKLYQLIFKNSNVILLSQYLYYDIEKYVDKKDVFYCHNGITDKKVDKSAIEKIDKVQVLFLSNLIISKGIFVLLDACKLLKSKGVGFICVFVGGAGDLDADQFNAEVGKMDLSDCVVYAGKKYGDEKERVFAQSDVFVHPTLNDCFPLVLLEAMQFSLPVVSTFEGGIPDIVDDGISGFLVPEGNSVQLAEKLELLIKNPDLRAQMGAVGRNKFENHYTEAKFEAQMIAILDNINQ